ncbi:MAG: phage holin family protein [Burkholderiaceae bacterium]
MVDPVASVGLAAALRNIVATLHSMLVTRVELASAELALARDHLVSSLALLMMASVFLFLALVAGSLLIAVIFWDTYRVEAVTGLTVGYAVIGVVLGLIARGRLKAMPGILEGTVEELRLDAQALRVAPAGAEAKPPGVSK